MNGTDAASLRHTAAVHARVAVAALPHPGSLLTLIHEARAVARARLPRRLLVSRNTRAKILLLLRLLCETRMVALVDRQVSAHVVQIALLLVQVASAHVLLDAGDGLRDRHLNRRAVRAQPGLADGRQVVRRKVDAQGRPGTQVVAQESALDKGIHHVPLLVDVLRDEPG